MGLDHGWLGAEAWIFLSIGDAAGEGSATLAQVIGAADSNNHAIPSVDEFNAAVSQLLGADLVLAEPNSYSLSATGRKLLDVINARKRGHIARFIDTARLWRERAPSTAPPLPWHIDAHAFSDAFEEYQRWFAEAVKRLQVLDRDKRPPGSR